MLDDTETLSNKKIYSRYSIKNLGLTFSNIRGDISSVNAFCGLFETDFPNVFKYYKDYSKNNNCKMVSDFVNLCEELILKETEAEEEIRKEIYYLENIIIEIGDVQARLIDISKDIDLSEHVINSLVLDRIVQIQRLEYELGHRGAIDNIRCLLVALKIYCNIELKNGRYLLLEEDSFADINIENRADLRVLVEYSKDDIKYYASHKRDILMKLTDIKDLDIEALRSSESSSELILKVPTIDEVNVEFEKMNILKDIDKADGLRKEINRM
ncbi:hypothetical protein [Poseidonibacter ostreae]|uniref:Uncharacterized protein n=1 Tax=Poseidonibacter ostreae TaxID=2654171 RepID=A0A6L4WY46_9BACT|nr:hypothetical protein [Poseidonibacter ostreae]KAB7891390.1 hypothetical protein GBG19_00710 [Poseidonibacter ostreae]